MSNLLIAPREILDEARMVRSLSSQELPAHQQEACGQLGITAETDAAYRRNHELLEAETALIPGREIIRDIRLSDDPEEGYGLAFQISERQDQQAQTGLFVAKLRLAGMVSRLLDVEARTDIGDHDTDETTFSGMNNRGAQSEIILSQRTDQAKERYIAWAFIVIES